MPGPLFHKFVIAMWQNAQKTVRKFCGSKEDKNKETHPEKPKKAKPGAFWVLEGMGTVENGSNQMRKPGVRTKTNPKTMQHMQKENRRKPSVFAGFLAGAEGLSLACRLGCCSLVGSAQHRPKRQLRPVRGRAPLALAHPSARGFGVDVGIRQREPWRTGFKLSFSQNHKRTVLVWCSQDGARRVPKPRLI